MTFVAAPAPSAAEPPIANSTFWPAVDPAQIRADQRLDGAITAPRLKNALLEAMASINAELEQWRQARMAEGAHELAAVAAEQIDGASILVQRYQRAVGCTAKALLLERYRDYDSSARGDKKADALADPIDDLRRDARWAVSDMCGVGRTTVELL